jgi:hypothetical protein
MVILNTIKHFYFVANERKKTDCIVIGAMIPQEGKGKRFYEYDCMPSYLCLILTLPFI